MALVRFGGGVAEIRGSINGNTFSRTRSGAIVRNRTTPVQPNTVLQSDVRQIMMEVADGFKQLTIDQVDLWAQVAQSLTRFNSFGESYVPSGKQIYTESNLNLRFCAQPLNSDSEKIQLNPNLPSIELGTAIVSTDTGVLDAMTLVASSNFGTRMIVQGTLPIPTGVRNYQKRLRQLGIAVTISSTPTAEDLVLNFETAFPGFTDWAGAAGLRVGFRARAVDIGTGLSSAWAYAEAIITEA